MSIAKRHLSKAKALLAASQPDNLIYAALHLRMCVEILTYQKLESYEDRVPQVAHWQPPQAVRALLKFEPDADQNFTIDIATGASDIDKIDGMDWLRVGEHKSLTAAWLKKNYPKLGSMLHEKTKSERGSKGLTAAYLLEVIATLEDVVKGNIHGSHHPIRVFDCVVCGMKVARNEEALRSGSTAECLNSECRTEYQPRVMEDGDIEMALVQDFPTCVRCKEGMAIGPASLQVGREMTCSKCKQVHRILGHNWIYGGTT